MTKTLCIRDKILIENTNFLKLFLSDFIPQKLKFYQVKISSDSHSSSCYLLNCVIVLNKFIYAEQLIEFSTYIMSIAYSHTNLFRRENATF